jgi:dTDP-4-dehydrorhamnose 3,5-epimerase
MENKKRYLGDVEVYNEPLFHDDRGTFIPTEIDHHNIQTNISINTNAYTFRGMHLQTGEFAQSKRLKVLSGQIIDFYVNLIPGDDYGKEGYLRMGPGDVIVVPRGYAHGFLTTCQNSMVQYLVDNKYSMSAETSINYQSFPLIRQIVLNEIGVNKLVISDKDAAAAISQINAVKTSTDTFGFDIYSNTSSTTKKKGRS